MKNYYADANIILRLLLKDLPDQTEKVEILFKKIVNQNTNIIILPSVLAEVLYVSTGSIYQIDREIIASQLGKLLRRPEFASKDNQIVLASLETYKKTAFDFVDCFLTNKAKSEATQVISFDKDLDRIDELVRVKI